MSAVGTKAQTLNLVNVFGPNHSDEVFLWRTEIFYIVPIRLETSLVREQPYLAPQVTSARETTLCVPGNNRSSSLGCLI